MKALRTIGIRTAIRYFWYSLYLGIIHWVFFPQIRPYLLRIFGAKVGKECIIMDIKLSNAHHHGFSRLKIGDRCFIADDVLLDCRGGVLLGDDVTVSERVNIVTHINVGYPDHPLQRFYPTRENRVTIGSGVYIGTGATIFPGVKIGTRSVVGAGAVVTRDVAELTVVAGVPAKRIKKILL
ncbi:MAG: acyltransferase [bacterium]|nr:acyltransferase [bacterium]